MLRFFWHQCEWENPSEFYPKHVWPVAQWVPAVLPNLLELLDVAIGAAERAAPFLRTEFHRAGGPRSEHESHAEVDREAELLIREYLCARTPEFSYLGEELGSSGPEPGPGRPLWLVDPNDGTSDFVQGYRGASIAIALVEDHQPVLGVVFAPNAPDDNGDLFWAIQGESPQRNGRILERTWPEEPSSSGVVLCAVDAESDEQAEAFLKPCRFRGVSSVAYRLSLLAAGEGDFAFSISGTSYWDFAAAHAIVRAAGGELYDADLRPVRYPTGCRGRCGKALLAGHESFVRAYAKGGFRPSFKPRPARRPSAMVREPALLRRAQGCLLGQLAGDSLGSLVEFQRSPRPVIDLEDGGPFQLLAGQPTDDSEMALTLARAIAVNGGYNAEQALAAYRRWKATGPVDIGSTTSAALDGRVNPDSEANGSLMRIAPMAIYAAGNSPERAAALGAEDASLTHPNPVCVSATAVFTAAAAFAIHTGSSPFETFRHALDTAAALGVPPQVFEALQRAEYEPPTDYYTQMGWVLIAFQNAFHRLLASPTLEHGVIETVAQGGDTDTNAAICGALMGAVHGRDAVPIRWQRMILTCRSNRPQELWPVDALTLAERLLLAGGENKSERG